MEVPAHRTWMYDRLLPGRKGYTSGFLKGVEEFIGFACRQKKYLIEGVIRCPCKLCKNEDHLTPDEVNVHIHQKGFTPGYWHWTSHGEELPRVIVDIDIDAPSSSSQRWGYEHVGRHQDMVFDAAGITHELSDEEEPPNMRAAEFYAMLNSAQRPLYPGCQNASELSVAVEMLSIKSKHNMSQACFNDIMKFMKKSSHPENVIPPDFRQTKKLVGGLGLSKMKIDCCVNGCMLYYKDDISLKECKFCNEPRYKARTVLKRNSKDVPRKRLHYLPLIPRLQRLYASARSAKHMRWHYENRREEGVLCRPSDGETWKQFDQVYPEFGLEPRNVRLGLCADGFTPFSQSSTQYSIWPVIVTPYNLPPELCMMTPYMFLTLIIPGPRSPRGKIDVYLQPLILWNDGVETYDASKKQIFLLRAALMWTINDFPAYGMLSGWSTAGKLACPICMEKSKAFSLKHGRKTSWFDCHRQFLPNDHAFRRNKIAFFKNRIERHEPPPRLSGEQVWERVFEIPNVVDAGLCDIPGRGISHNWTKRSIFWDLLYWRHNLLRHNLDVMHIEKNVQILPEGDGLVQAVYMQEYPAVNATQSSSSHVSGENDANKIPILPEGDGFDRHKLVVSEIASIIRSNLEGGIPSWKQLSEDLRNQWFLLFGKKFTWPPEYKDKVRRNFERRGSAKMTQLMQEARRDLEQKPIWMGEATWAQLKAYWESSRFKKKSVINQRNRESMDGASLHTGGSIPHRLHWKRMKEEKGTDLSLTDFYFRTHRKKDQSWVGVHAEAVYDKFEQKKNELSSQNSTIPPGENGADSQPSIEMPSDLDIWVDTVGKKKGRVFGLGSVTKTLIPSSTSKTKKPNYEEVDALKSQIHALNESLQRQFQRHEQENMEMREELTETRRQVTALMEHLGFAASSSRPPPSPQNYNNENEDDNDDFSDHLE